MLFCSDERLVLLFNARALILAFGQLCSMLSQSQVEDYKSKKKDYRRIALFLVNVISTIPIPPLKSNDEMSQCTYLLTLLPKRGSKSQDWRELVHLWTWINVKKCLATTVAVLWCTIFYIFGCCIFIHISHHFKLQNSTALLKKIPSHHMMLSL